MPEDIDVAPNILAAKNWAEKNVYPWELETIAKELIINSTYSTLPLVCPKTLKRSQYFAGAVNKLKDLENNIARTYSTKENVLIELYRIIHRQLPWQNLPSAEQLTRYFKIFSYPSVDDLVRNRIGIPVRELYLIGMLFTGAYLKHSAINLPITLTYKELNSDKIETFLKYFSKNIDTLKELIKKEQEINDKFVYSYSSLRAYPIIKMVYRGKERLVCPLPTLLFWRITSGIYYEICNEKYFGAAFGTAFQNFVGEVIERASSNKSIISISEREYYVGKSRKDTVDRIIYDKDAVLFIECKTRRMKMSAKIELHDDKPIKEGLEEMAEFILQIYKTIADYRGGKYPTLRYEQEKKIFPLILTLENWFIFGDKLIEDLRALIVRKINDKNLPLELLEEAPYSICSLEEFEKLIQIIQKVGIQKVLETKCRVGEYNKWGFGPFLTHKFPEESRSARFLFKNEYDTLFQEYSQKEKNEMLV